MGIPQTALDQWLVDKGIRSAYEVNSGDCENFAMDHKEYIPGSEIIGTDNMLGWDTDYPGHIWLFDGSKHYDSEALEGVVDYLDLPIFKRYINRSSTNDAGNVSL